VTGVEREGRILGVQIDTRSSNVYSKNGGEGITAGCKMGLI